MRPWSATLVPPLLDGRTLDAFCDLLTQLNVWYLEDTPGVPDLYASGVRYASDYEAIGGQPERWDSIPWLIARWRKHGIGADCKRLCAWRAAELRVRDRERARCTHTSRWEGGRVLFHVLVERADGSLEDPSAILGMHEHLARNPLPPALVAGYPWRFR